MTIIGAVGTGLGILITNVFRGGSQRVSQLDAATTKLIETLQNQIKALEDSEQITRARNHELGNQMQIMSGKIGVLEGQLKEKDKKLEEYAAILQNRSPEMEKYMNETNKILKELVSSNHEIKKFMMQVDKRLSLGESKGN